MERELIFSARKKDFRVDTFRSGGPGGQNQNKLETGVRITHIETGLSCESREHKSQHMNKVAAFKRLAHKLHNKILEEMDERPPLPTEVIRTYSDKDDRVKDYASGKTFSYWQVVTKGDISKPLEARLKATINAT
jgi:peptide chain release factor 1